MAKPTKIRMLAEDELKETHNVSVKILNEIGVRLNHDGIFDILAGQNGVQIDKNKKLVKFSEERIMGSISSAGKKVKIYGRNLDKYVPYGYGYVSFISNPGQFTWIESDNKTRRNSTMEDLHDAIRVGDALEQIDVVGAMAQPDEIPIHIRDIRIYVELLKGTVKPVVSWIYNRRKLKWILEILKVVADGEKKLRENPMVHTGIEPISPLQFSYDSIDLMIELVAMDQPFFLGPIAQCMATAPGTLIGTIAQENAEILAGVVISQILKPGATILYSGAPVIMDPATMVPSFGSPEQALMAATLAQIGNSYGFSVYANIGLSDSKTLDYQNGFERAFTLLFGVLAGVEGAGSYGFTGMDQGSSLVQLVADNEMLSYFRRLYRGFEVNEEKLAFEIVKNVGQNGNFLLEEHTRRNFREEIWFPKLVDRQYWEPWVSSGSKDMMKRAREELECILKNHNPEPISEALEKEIEEIVKAAELDLSKTY